MRKIAALARLAGAALLAVMPAQAWGQAINGPARAVDGDSLSMTGTRVRLHGIDAPELDQICTNDQGEWPCGKQALVTLYGLVEGKQVRCKGVGQDAHGRVLATCHAGVTDLAHAMVAAGLAIPLPEESDAYVELGARAQTYKFGLWAGQFDEPAAWRAAHPAREPVKKRRAAPEQDGPDLNRIYRNALGCAIKGNRNRKGEWIYHLPGMPYYDATRPEELFCTEAQALAGGYRRAIVR